MRKLTAILLFLLATPPAFAQKKELTLETIYDPTTKVYFSGSIQSGFEWLDDKTLLWPKKDEKGKLVEWQVFDTATGKSRPFLEKAKLQSALEAAGLGSDEAKDAAARTSFTFDAKKSAALIDAADDLFLFTFADGKATRLTNAAGTEEEATFSPDGKRVAFLRAHNLYVIDLGGGERQLTSDGNAKLLNGKLDWVYQEEIYGRGIFKGYWWSPDSSKLAFLQLDESPVPLVPIVDHIPYHQDLEEQAYPKAGDPNPKVKLFLVPAAGGERTQVDNERYSGGEFLIVNVAWTKKGDALTYQVQDREQTWLDLDSADPSSGASKTLIHDTTKAWVDPLMNPMFLSDGSFLWRSERGGFDHLYHYKGDGTLIRQLTSGEWEVTDVHGVDEKSGVVYFSGDERSPIGVDVYKIKLDGSGMTRISDKPGTHVATFNPALSLWVDKWSDVRTPDQIRVHRPDGTVAWTVDENKVAALTDYALNWPELLQVKNRDGFVMEAWMIKPPNFDPSKKYPVYQYLYGGPHAPQVRNTWRGAFTLFQQLIAQQGVIVWMCDNKTASGKGAQSVWPLYKEFGANELRDVEDGIAWLKSQPYVDGSHIMLSGWSYGGFMTSYALTHSKTFVAGISGGTVADWRDYDTVYTERYMLMPQHNPEGYKKSSPRFAAKDLHGRLLLLHGTIDDNVHMQNAIQFAYDLEKAGKTFEMVPYPKSRHGVTQPALVYHLQKTILEFVRRNLLE